MKAAPFQFSSQRSAVSNPPTSLIRENKKEHFSRQMEFTLTTRKIVFGLLLVLVLAFSMQGIADAHDAGRLTVRVDPFDGAPGSKATVTFTALDADNQPALVTVTLSAIGGTLSRSSESTGTDGSGTVILTRGNTLGNENYVTASVPGYVPALGRFLITGTPIRTTTTRTTGAAAALAIYNGNLQSGALNMPLAEPFIVEVIDADYSPVEDIRVWFQVTQGSGRFSPRTLRTDAEGLAETTFTPTSTGSISVEATAGGVDTSAAFIVSVEEAPAAADPVISSTRIEPKVLVAAANRPPMLWVDGGAIYGLVDANAQRFAPSVDNAMNIAVDASNAKVYWTEQTGERRGTINSADLDGTSVTELTAILSVPMGIAVDATGNKLYWTNSRGRIQCANLDGSGIKNVMSDLPGPMDIAVARGIVCWTQFDATAGTGNVGIVHPTAGQRIARYISTGSDTPGSLVINGGKVYWTEMMGTNSGTINSANLNGTDAAQLASILAAPSGIAVDTARSKLYWTNARGRVQRASLNGSGIQNVVEGLGSPGEIVISNSISETLAGTPLTPTVSHAKYDVNGDGKVDNTDAGLVIDALGTNNARYDVNGDGAVDFLDVVLVFDNRDDNVAGAPTLVGMKLSAVQIDRIEEQIDLLIATNDRSPSALRTLVYLQQLLATARPEKTQLFANYPNPFNPETWIPYELATDTHVKITIYNTQGVMVRSLSLGQQSAGYYTGRDRAAYWDGRNALGEQVASGLYFYQLETDEMSSMRKMVILK